MLASILIGLSALVAVSLSAALLLFAYLKGRIRRAVALAVAGAAVSIGAAIAGSGALGGPAFGPMAVPFGVFLMLAGAVNGFLAHQARKR